MELAESVQKQVEASKKAVKMSSMFNNELLHALSLHYLTNDLDFPPDLFYTYDLDSQAVKSLKKSFPNQRDLDRFFQDNSNPFPSQLVEKTAILGLFWKSLLLQLLRINKATDNDYLKSEGKNKSLPMDLFEQLLEVLAIPLNIYCSKTDKYIGVNDIHNPAKPTLDLMINPNTNDCYLVQTVNPVSDVLDEYSMQAEAYADEVTKVKTKGQTTSMGVFSFLEASINPFATPMTLCDVVETMSKRQAVSSKNLPNSPLVSDSEESLREECSESLSEERSFEQDKFDEELERLEENLELLVGRIIHYNKTIQIIQKDKDLTSLEKAEKIKPHQKAAGAAVGLHNALTGSLENFRNSDQKVEDYRAFRKSSINAIRIHKPELKNHRDFDKIIANLVGAILGLIVIYAAVLAINYLANGFRNTMWHSEGQKVVESIEDNIENLAEFYKP